jgi:hypothetical protein
MTFQKNAVVVAIVSEPMRKWLYSTNAGSVVVDQLDYIQRFIFGLLYSGPSVVPRPAAQLQQLVVYVAE